MAQLVYDKTGRLLFPQEMKKEYTILFPTMLPVHFGLMARILETEGFKVEMLTTNHRGIVDEGLKYVHNDTCYPALLVIGQLIDAVKHGGYDPHKVGLLITQTGGGCRVHAGRVVDKIGVEAGGLYLLRSQLASELMDYGAYHLQVSQFLGADVGEKALQLSAGHGIALAQIAQRGAQLPVRAA